MNKERKIQSWLPLVLSLVMILGMWGGYQLFKHMGWNNSTVSSGGGGSVQQILDLVKLKYVDSLDLDSLELNGIQSITTHLDPHSVFIPAEDYEDLEADITGNFSGIGIEYQIIQDTLRVVNVLEKGPASREGILPGDAIIKVNDSVITSRNIQRNDLRRLLRGKAGTRINVTISRKGNIIIKTITRGEVPLPSVDLSYMIAPGTGYIRLNRFSETTFFEFMDAATALGKKGMNKMILDLRGNGGGLLNEATNIADELLEDGLTIVSTKGDKVKPKTIFATKPGLFEQGNMVVLIDEQSASASEVLAGALQDNDRATIIGTRSFGKGLVQEQYRLSNGGALRLTVARYYTPLGRCIQKPYENGADAYQQEIFNRIHNHSTSQQTDTIGKKVFITRKGKRLFESGGITPEIWVPADSNSLPLPILNFFSGDHLTELVFRLYRQFGDSLSKYPTALSFDTGYALPPSIWQVIKTDAAKENVDLSTVKGSDRDMIEARIKARLARFRWMNHGYFELQNRRDPMVRKALEFLKTSKPAI